MMPSLKMCKPQKQVQQNNTVTPVSPSECTRALKHNSLMVRFTSQRDSRHLNDKLWVLQVISHQLIPTHVQFSLPTLVLLLLRVVVEIVPTR